MNCDMCARPLPFCDCGDPEQSGRKILTYIRLKAELGFAARPQKPQKYLVPHGWGVFTASEVCSAQTGFRTHKPSGKAVPEIFFRP